MYKGFKISPCGREGIQDVCLEAINKAQACFATDVPSDILELLSTSSNRHSIGRRFANSYLGLIIDDFQ